MAQDKTTEGRARLATSISEFFEEHELSKSEQTLATEIMMALLKQAERGFRPPS